MAELAVIAILTLIAVIAIFSGMEPQVPTPDWLCWIDSVWAIFPFIGSDLLALSCLPGRQWSVFGFG